MKRFRGTYERSGWRVDVVEDGINPWSMKLNPRLDVRNHSPDGFSWGYAGSGPSQLALAILIEALQDTDRALLLYQSFKDRVIARFGQEDDWDMTQDQVFEWVHRLEAERGDRCEISAEGSGDGR